MLRFESKGFLKDSSFTLLSIGGVTDLETSGTFRRWLKELGH